MTESLVVLSTSWLTTLAPAIAGVVGVAVGGGITYATTMRREAAARRFDALAQFSADLRGVVTSLTVALSPPPGQEDKKPMDDARWFLGETRTRRAGVDLLFPPEQSVAMAAGAALESLQDAVDACTQWRDGRTEANLSVARARIRDAEDAIGAFNEQARKVL